MVLVVLKRKLVFLQTARSALQCVAKGKRTGYLQTEQLSTERHGKHATVNMDRMLQTTIKNG